MCSSSVSIGDLPVVCFHGSPGTIRDFNPLIKRIPQYTLNPLVRKNYPNYDLVHYSSAGDKDSILLGFSWGCRDSLEFFIKHSDKIKGIILVSPYILHSEKSSFFKNILTSSRHLSALFTKMQTIVTSEYTMANRWNTTLWNSLKIKFLFNFLIAIRSIYEKMEHQLISYASILRTVGTFDIPLHVIYGKQDFCSHVNSSVSMIKNILPNTIFHSVEDGGHCLLSTHPTIIADSITSLQTSQDRMKFTFPISFT